MAAALAVAIVSSCGSGSGGGGNDTPPAPTATPGGSATPTSFPTAPPSSLPALRLTEVARGFDQPLFTTTAPSDPSRLFVVEQTGRIRIVADGTLRERAFLDLSSAISCCGERGLLGLAFHPDYATNGRFYVDYTDLAGNTVIAEHVRGTDAESAEPVARRILLTVDQPFSNHNGGMLAFGPDGLLYIGLGDGGGAGDPQNNAQRLTTKLGKILRIDVDSYPTSVPGNLAGGDPDIWDFGLRNPWRFSFDRATGDLYIGDVGQNAFEEIDVEPRGEGGRNYGWRITEGRHCFDPATGCDTSGITLPVVEYDHDAGCSVIGGYVYRGPAIPELAGRYFYADFCSSRIWTFVYAGGAATDERELTSDLDPAGELGGITSFGEDAAGELLIVDQRGIVFRVERE